MSGVVRLEVWAERADEDLERLIADLGPDGWYVSEGARSMVARLRYMAPRRSGRLRASFQPDRNTVVSSAPYAVLQSEGGVILPRHRRALIVPFAPGYDPRSGRPGYTVYVNRGATRGYVFSGPYALEAVRRARVVIPGNRYLERAKQAALVEDPDQIARDLEARPPGVPGAGGRR